MSKAGNYPTLLASVLSRLRADILSCRLAPGAVVTDNALAAYYGVSTSPIREALAQMVMEQLVEVLPNKAKRISPIDRKSVKDFLEVHAIIAQASFSQGAPHIGAAQLQTMTDARKGIVSTYQQGEIWPHLDAVRRFLDPVHLAGGNLELRRLIILNSGWLLRLVTILGPRFYQCTLPSTEMILQSFRKGDIAFAVQANLEMIDNFIRKVLDLSLPED